MPEQTEEKQYHKLTRSQKILLSVGFALLVLLVAPIFGFFYYKFAVNRPSQVVDELTYRVQKGALVSEIADDLYNLGIINSKVLFSFYVNWNKIDKDIQAGVYTIPAGISIVNLADMLQHGVNDVKVTFLEGWRVEEFAREATIYLSNIDYNKFLAIARSHEGYLFPDTYMFNSDVQEDRLLEILLETFDDKARDLFTESALAGLGMTLDEALIFASIVEREVHQDEDRPIVAGILIKRWREDMPLGADATTQYAIAVDKYCVPTVCRAPEVSCDSDPEISACLAGLSKDQALDIDWWPQDLTTYDLDFESSHNTRKVLGLPPTPICSPSVAAIEAVLNYQDSEYYYYLNDSEGRTHYARDLDEHAVNIQTYLSD